jgi:hypothetical protein
MWGFAEAVRAGTSYVMWCVNITVTDKTGIDVVGHTVPIMKSIRPIRVLMPTPITIC